MKRTRQLLQKALRELLPKKPLDEILVQDITEAATVNRATFYDHYTDKFALFTAMVACDFHKLLEERNIRFEESSGGLAAIILAVCDYLKQVHSNQAGCARQGSFTPLVDSAITLAVRGVVLDGLRRHGGEFSASREVVASAVSWAIHGAAREWFSSANQQPAEEVVPSLVQLILPLVEKNTAAPHAALRPGKHVKGRERTATKR